MTNHRQRSAIMGRGKVVLRWRPNKAEFFEAQSPDEWVGVAFNPCAGIVVALEYGTEAQVAAALEKHL